ncbi:S41 family peptidase [Peptostreptococcus faecalis]|uniref:S41 family peptidase n=1 Tax=Peptostreptococcus faecalis TaxID=2045015 RepID=UPI000C7D6E97|nr:S41 family peptidase [Peptostreptococcus faecalis]
MKFNKKQFLKNMGLVVATAIVTTFVLTQFNIVAFLPNSEYEKYKKLIGLNEAIHEDFYKKPNEEKLEEGIYKGLFYGTEDVYSAYYTKDEMRQLMESSSGKYVGIGMLLKAEESSGLIVVERVFENSPAKTAGVKKGDQILKINGKSYANQDIDIATKNIRGEEGTQVDVSFMRDKKIINKKLTRKEIKIESIKSEMKEDNIGYVKIESFDEDTDKDFRSAILNLKKNNMKALIIDVRDNGGGLLDSVEKISDQILGEGVIVYTEDNKKDRVYLKSTDKEKINLPLVVLTNEHSASASEILTGAIVDNKAGISIGTTTYGKGLVQSVVGLRDGSGYKLTTSQYFTPNGNYIDKKGIKPTIEVKNSNEQLQKAVEYLKEKLKSS